MGNVEGGMSVKERGSRQAVYLSPRNIFAKVGSLPFLTGKKLFFFALQDN